MILLFLFIYLNRYKVIIFAETKKGCEALCYKLKKDRWNVLSIHGDKS